MFDTNKLDHATLTKLFADEDSAREYIEQIRWPSGAYCPHCGSVRVYRITANAASKVRKGLFKCGDCQQQFTVKVGTIFEDSKIPLNKWFHAIHLLCSSKRGVSAHQIHRTVGITYKSAWFMMHRVRYAMAEEPLASQLSGIVESDETFIGGKAKNMHKKERAKKIQGRGSVNKEAVVTLVERGGRVKTTHVGQVTGENVKEVLRQHVSNEARLMTDESALYNGSEKEYADHQTVNHKAGEYVRGDAHVNTGESVHSLMKRGVIGTYYHWSVKHLHRYCSEFDFRWNLRKVKDGERTIEVLKSVEGKRLYYRDPIKQKE
jgi:transposase-like protein